MAMLEIALMGLPDVTISIASSAEDALLLIQDDPKICALVTDLHLKGMDGFELIQRVRSHHRYKNLPIVVISGDPETGTPDRALRLGANAFFEKPYSPRQVRRTLEGLIHAASSENPA